MEQHPELFSHFHFVEAVEEDHELWLEAPCQVVDLDKREELSVLEAEESMLQEIAHFRPSLSTGRIPVSLSCVTKSKFLLLLRWIYLRERPISLD